LAAAVIDRAADLFDLWGDAGVIEHYGLTGIDYEESRQVVANWLGKLPGDYWTKRLPQPKRGNK